MNFLRIILLFLFCFSSFSVLPFWDELFDIFSIEDEYDWYEPERYDLSRNAQSGACNYSESILRGYTRTIKLKGVTGAKNLPGFYHHESYATVPLKKDWKCGLHMLYNMCEIERALNLSSITDAEYIAACKKIPDLFDKKGSYPKDLKKAAGFVAHAPLYIVEHNEDTNRIDIVIGARSEKTFWTKIQNQLDRPGVQCVHFGCLIYDEDSIDEDGNPECHIFLISAVKLHDGSMSLYLLDNMNRQASRSAQKQMLRHAEYIHEHVFG